MFVAEYWTEKENRGQKNKRKVVHTKQLSKAEKKKKVGNYVLLWNKVLAGSDGKDEWLRMKFLNPTPAPNLNISFHQLLKKDSSIFCQDLQRLWTTPKQIQNFFCAYQCKLMLLFPHLLVPISIPFHFSKGATPSRCLRQNIMFLKCIWDFLIHFKVDDGINMNYIKLSSICWINRK